jgi:hypothetical protein
MQLICLIMNTTNDSLYRKCAIYKYRKDNHWDTGRLGLLTCTMQNNAQEQ